MENNPVNNAPILISFTREGAIHRASVVGTFTDDNGSSRNVNFSVEGNSRRQVAGRLLKVAVPFCYCTGYDSAEYSQFQDALEAAK